VRWRRFFERERRDEEFARELEAHVAHEVDELIARGLSPAEARSRARRKLGNTTRLREAAYERNSSAVLEAVVNDVRHALRRLRSDKAFAVLAVLSLAFGIGANTAVFSLMDQTLWRPLPVTAPEELVLVYQPGPLQGHESSDEPDGPSFSYPLFKSLQESQTPFTGLAGARSASGLTLCYGTRTTTATAHRVSGNYFKLLGTRPALGRILTEADDGVPGANPVVVLSHHYWMSWFGGDVSVLHQTLTLNNVPLTIVGVAARGFFGESHGGWPDLFVPITMSARLQSVPAGALESRREHWVTLLARLKPGITRDRAQVELQVAYRAEVLKDLPGLQLDAPGRARYRTKQILLKAGERGRGGGSSADETVRRLVLLPAITLMVLLIACANIANLQLSRAAARTREVTVRLAVGASRAALLRPLLTESCLLALAGGAVGLWVARWLLPVLGTRIETAPVGPLSSHVDARVMLFCLLLSVLTGLAFGLYPSLRASQADLATALKGQSSQSGVSSSARRFHRTLVAVQLAISLVLLVAAGLLTRTLVNIGRVDLGFAADRLLTLRLQPELSGYSGTKAAAYYEEVQSRLTALPGVRSVAVADEPVIAGDVSSGNITIDGFQAGGEDPNVAYNHVGPGFLATMGIGLLAGRDFTAHDVAGAPKVAIVNETFVTRYLAGANPLGRRFGWGSGNNTKLDIEVVGVARNAHYHFLREEPRPFYYLALGQKQRQGAVLYVRADEAETLLGPVRGEIEALDRQVPVRGLKTLRGQVEQSLSSERGVSVLAAAFGALATLLAALGLYGVLSGNVAARTREIGIRIALGAQAGDVRRMLAREVSTLLALGGALGLAGAGVFGGMVRAMLYGITPWDPAVYAAAFAVLGSVGVLAAYMPARRAMRIDPVVALRDE
jgi:putative ABC transport system permease protein